MGPTIEPALKGTLFDPLRRPSGHRKDNRLGLGLYIAQQIVIAHGGTIEVSSTAETGTRFTARLPRDANKDPHNRTIRQVGRRYDAGAACGGVALWHPRAKVQPGFDHISIRNDCSRYPDD